MNYLLVVYIPILLTIAWSVRSTYHRGRKFGSSGIWGDGHNLHYINSKHDEVQLRTVGNSLILSCSVLVES